MADELVAERVMVEGGMHPLRQFETGEFGIGTRERGGIGQLVETIETTQPRQAVVLPQAIDQRFRVGQVEDCLGDEGTGQCGSVTLRPSGMANQTCDRRSRKVMSTAGAPLCFDNPMMPAHAGSAHPFSSAIRQEIQFVCSVLQEPPL